MDAIHYHVRSEGQIVKKAVCIAMGVNLGGGKSVLAEIWDKKYPKDLKILERKLGKSQHIFQVPGGASAADLYDQCHRRLQSAAA